MSYPRFTRDEDNRVTDQVSRLRTAPLTEAAAKLIVKGGNSADAIMRCMGSVASSHEEGGYCIHVDRYTFHITEMSAYYRPPTTKLELTPEEIQAVLAVIAPVVADTKGPLERAERELDGALMAWEDGQHER